jgi:cold shock CspA family protein
VTTSSTGTVTAFDEWVGLGTITSEGGVEHTFHCIEIADGSRTIAVGATVSFDLLAKFGRYEAASVRS